MSKTQRLDDLCQKTTNPTVLNALHACRDGHPLGKNNPYKWGNAFFLCSGCKDFVGVSLVWLQDMSFSEERAI